MVAFSLVAFLEKSCGSAWVAVFWQEPYSVIHPYGVENSPEQIFKVSL